MRDRLESGYHEPTVTGLYREAMSMCARGIPGFTLGNILFNGARPCAIVKVVVDKVLDS